MLKEKFVQTRFYYPPHVFTHVLCGWGGWGGDHQYYGDIVFEIFPLAGPKPLLLELI